MKGQNVQVYHHDCICGKMTHLGKNLEVLVDGQIKHSFCCYIFLELEIKILIHKLESHDSYELITQVASIKLTNLN